MSLVRIGLRTSAIEAIRGRTFVGDAVLDSEIGAFEVRPDGMLEANVEKRFIAVYTQSGAVEKLEFGPRGLHEGGTVELIFEMGITATMMVRDDVTGRKDVLEGVPSTDAAFEFYLDLLGKQIVDCLIDPDNEWAEIWRGFVSRIVKVELLRTDNAQHVRLAGHQLKITCEVVDDPIRGIGLDAGGAMAKMIAKLDGDDNATDTAKARLALLKTAIGDASNQPWRTQQMTMGLSAVELLALGLAPLATDEAGEVPDLAGVTVERGGSDTVVTSDD